MTTAPRQSTARAQRPRFLSTIRQKLTAMAVMVVAVLALVGGVSYSGMRSVAKASEDVRQQSLLVAAVSASYEGWLLDDDQSNMYAALVALKDPAQADLITTTWGQAQDGLTTARAELDKAKALAAPGVETTLVGQLAEQLDSFDSFSKKMHALGEKGDVAAAIRVATVENLEPSNALPELFEKLRSTSLEERAAKQRQLSATASDTQRWVMVLGILGGLSALVVCLQIRRSITGPMDATLAVLQRVAQGDLRDRLHPTGADELADMGRALDAALDRVGTTVTSIITGAKDLNGASTRLLTMSENVSRNADSVASASEEMAVTTREIAGQTNEVASIARDAVRLADDASTTMGALRDHSQTIGSVIESISSIAAQTNLLALNATIESARAGEAGRGFAIVANEVKELAFDTGRATGDVTQAITAVQQGANEAINGINRISEVIRALDDSQNTIAAATEQQTATTAEITRAVNVTAGQAGEIARDAQQLAGLAGTLNELVLQFNT